MKKKLYVLDTNVLMHDPTSVFRFEEHDVFLPMTVLEELDHGKKGLSEVARNVRQVSRFLNDMMTSASKEEILQGLPIAMPEGLNLREEEDRGKLFFQTTTLKPDHNHLINSNIPDNLILHTALALKERRQDRQVVLVSKDINLRIKATIAGMPAEDYHNDKALDDLSLLYTGALALPADFWEQLEKIDSWTESGRTFYRIVGDFTGWYPNQCIYVDEENGMEAIVLSVEGNEAVVKVADDFRNENHSVWGIMARNREQNFALNLLMDPDIDFVTLLGSAGTGKTLLSLAAGLTQTLDEKRYTEIIMTRATVPVGEDIGFLPGTEEEKMNPWMGALTDNMEVLTNTSEQEGGEWGRQATQELLSHRIKVRSMNFMRGRTFLNRFVIIDEAQNLTSKQMKTLLTRAGPGSKMICMGNIEQIDTPYLTETTSGLTYVVDRFKQWMHSGHITLKRGERSRLADYASDIL